MMRQSTLPLLVSLHSGWDVAMTPALSQIVGEAAGRLQAIQVDICVYPQIAERFKVRIIPILLLFKQDVPVEFVVGLALNLPLIVRFVVMPTVQSGSACTLPTKTF
jgi:thioredoxin-like negative regulator of GroEL